MFVIVVVVVCLCCCEKKIMIVDVRARGRRVELSFVLKSRATSNDETHPKFHLKNVLEFYEEGTGIQKQQQREKGNETKRSATPACSNERKEEATSKCFWFSYRATR